MNQEDRRYVHGQNTAVVDTPFVETSEEEIAQCRQEVARLEEQARALVIDSDVAEEAALLFISEAKRSFNAMEEDRKKKVKPLNENVKAINAAYAPFTEILERLWRATDHERSAYLTRKQQAIDAANRKAIADAAEARRIEEAKAEAARQEAERLRVEAERIEQERVEREYQEEMARLAAEKKKRDEEQAVIDAKRKGDAAAAKAAQDALNVTKKAEEDRLKKVEEDRLASVAEQDRVEKAAIKQDAKADIAESKATMVAPTIQVNESLGARTLVDGSKIGTRKLVDWHFENGMAKDKNYYQDDERLQGIPKRYWLLDLTKLGKDVKNGVPIEGTIRTEGSMTTAGRK